MVVFRIFYLGNKFKNAQIWYIINARLNLKYRQLWTMAENLNIGHVFNFTFFDLYFVIVKIWDWYRNINDVHLQFLYHHIPYLSCIIIVMGHLSSISRLLLFFYGHLYTRTSSAFVHHVDSKLVYVINSFPRGFLV